MSRPGRTTGIQRQVRLNTDRDRRAAGATKTQEIKGIIGLVLADAGRETHEVRFTIEGDYVVARLA